MNGPKFTDGQFGSYLEHKNDRDGQHLLNISMFWNDFRQFICINIFNIYNNVI